jgi:hypothetical protein
LGWIMGKDDMVGFHPAPGAVLACVCVDC